MTGVPQSSADFFGANGWCIELARVGGNSNLGYVLYKRGEGFRTARRMETRDFLFMPPEEDEFTKYIRFAETVGDELEVRHLLTKVDDFLSWCIELDERRRFLLACFVLSTWVVDWLSVAPYIALVGLPGSGKSTALRILYLICRRGLITYDISSAAFYRACDRFAPTLCIDEAATAGGKRALYHLLRSGTTRDAAAFRVGQSYRAYGAKAVSWNEMPDDEALNSRCIIIPMKESSRNFSVRTTDADVLEEANYLQGLLLRYRLDHYGTDFRRELPGQERLRSRDRDLYEALALPLCGNRELCAALLECFEQQKNVNRDPLPPKQVAVLQGLFKQIHVQPDREDYALGQLKNEANLSLSFQGERFRLNERTVSEILKTFGFVDRKRTKSGWVVLADSAARKRLHELLWLYGVDLSACLPAEPSTEWCEFCKVQDTREDNIQGNFPTFDRKRWAYTEEEDDVPEDGGISPPVKRRRAQAARERQERLERLSEARAEWERSLLDPSELVSGQQVAIKVPAEPDRISEPVSNESKDGNGAGLGRTSVSVPAESSAASGKTQGAIPAEPASISEGAGERPGNVGRPARSSSNGGEHGEHGEHENRAEMAVRPSSSHLPSNSGTAQGPERLEPNSAEAGARGPGVGTGEVTNSGLTRHDHDERGENGSDFGMDAEALRREAREDRDLRERVRYDVMHPSEEELEEEIRKQVEHESELDRPTPDAVGKQQDRDDADRPKKI